MSDDESSESYISVESESTGELFEPHLQVTGDVQPSKFLSEFQDVPENELLDKVGFDILVFRNRVSRESKEYERLLKLLESNRRWRIIEVRDHGQIRSTPELLSLVVSAVTKANELQLSDCPLDENFFASLMSGMQTLTHLNVRSSNIKISLDAAAMFATGLAMSGSLERLEIQWECWFELGGADLKLVEGIKRNKSLKNLKIHELSLSTEAMISILRAVSEGSLPNIITLDVGLENESSCLKNLTKLMCSDTCCVEDLTINTSYYSPNTFRTDGVRMGRGNHKLKSLRIACVQLDESYLKEVLPMMPTLSHLELTDARISDISPIVDHLCRPNTAIKSINLRNNKIGIDQAEKFVESLADMRFLTDVNIAQNSWCYGRRVDEERARGVLKKVSNSRNLEKFELINIVEEMNFAHGLDLQLNLAINRAWRRELCYKKSSPSSKLLPLVIARALQKTENDLRADVILPLLQERLSDLMPVRNDENSQKVYEN